MKPRVSILSIDGGGLKGLIAIKVLRELEMICNAPVSSLFNLLAGTSTGGLIVAALGVPDEGGRPRYDLEHIEDIYTEVGMQVFMNGGFSVTGKHAARLNGILRETFGDVMISQARTPLFIPAFDEEAEKIIVFKTRSAAQDRSKDASLVDVCRATSAIAPLFPPYPLRYHGRTVKCVDAGYHLKNPALSALAEVWKHAAHYAGGRLREDEIFVLSVSTGSHRGKGKDWSLDISEVTGRQGMDMKYIRSQGLEIDLGKVGYLRVDIDLGHGAFSLSRLAEWLNRIRALGGDRRFISALKRVSGR